MSGGSLITFEGPEGAGKSTQVRLLADDLRVAGFRVVETREPGGTPLGERVRSLLLDHASSGMIPQAEVLLLNAARAQHVHEVIAPAVEAGAIVLCDRFADSTLAYQGGGRGLPLETLRCIQHFAISEFAPALRILLDLPVELGLDRRRAAAGTANRLDDENLHFHLRVRDTFLRLAEADPAGWVVVDARATVPEVARRIRDAVFGKLAVRSDGGNTTTDRDIKVPTRA